MPLVLDDKMDCFVINLNFLALEKQCNYLSGTSAAS